MYETVRLFSTLNNFNVVPFDYLRNLDNDLEVE